MKPNSIENLEIVADDSLSNVEKIRRLIEANSDSIDHSGQDATENFNTVMDRVFPHTDPANDGRSSIESAEQRKDIANRETTHVTAQNIPRLGELSLQLLVYKPNSLQYSPSIVAKWTSAGKIVLREDISLKMFDKGSGAYSPQAAEMLDLVSQSVDAYEELKKASLNSHS